MDSYWNPFHELETLRRGIDELFTTAWPGTVGRAARAAPLMNIAAEDDRFVVTALAPGLDPASIDVTIDHGVLTIAGEKTGTTGVAAEKFHRRERAAGRFRRSVRLDCDIDEDKVEARYTDGVLGVVLPKARTAMPRRIDVATH